MPYLIPTISRLGLALAFGSLLTLLCTFLFLPSRTFPILYPCSGACPPSVPLFFYFCFLFVCSPIASSSVFVSIILYSAFSKSLSHLNPFLPPFQPPVMAPPVSLWHLFMAFGIITPGTLPDCSYKASLPGNYYLQALSSSVLPPYRNPSVSSEQHNEEGI